MRRWISDMTPELSAVRMATSLSVQSWGASPRAQNAPKTCPSSVVSGTPAYDRTEVFLLKSPGVVRTSFTTSGLPEPTTSWQRDTSSGFHPPAGFPLELAALLK